MISCGHAMREARRMFLSSYGQELEGKGILPPSRNCSPLWPPWSNVEYEAMERDTPKYFLYYSAISAAFSDFKIENSNTVINILVLGPGRGRLVDYSIDCLTQNNLQGMIHVVESNISCCQVLQNKYCDATNVCVHPPITIRDSVETLTYIQSGHAPSSIKLLTEDKNIDIIISELFGSFSDNEFMPEILNVCIELFGGEKCFSIPAEYESFVVPISSPTLQRFFDKYESDNGCVESLFVLGLPDDANILSQSQETWKSSCCRAPPVNQSIVQFRLKVKNQFHALSASAEPKCSESKFRDNSGSLPNENMIPVLSGKDNVCLHVDTTSVSLSTQASDSTSLGQLNILKPNISNENLNNRSYVVTGFAGHFTASLYKDIVIDTRPGCSRNTYFWESAFFPLNLTTRNELENLINSGNNVFSFVLRRVFKKVGQVDEKCDLDCKIDRWCNPKHPVYHLHYEYAIISECGENVGNTHNENGVSHALYL